MSAAARPEPDPVVALTRTTHYARQRAEAAASVDPAALRRMASAWPAKQLQKHLDALASAIVEAEELAGLLEGLRHGRARRPGRTASDSAMVTTPTPEPVVDDSPTTAAAPLAGRLAGRPVQP